MGTKTRVGSQLQENFLWRRTSGIFHTALPKGLCRGHAGQRKEQCVGALFYRRDLLDCVFRRERAAAVGIFDDGEQATRRMRARVTRAFAIDMRCIARSDVNGNAGVDVSVAAFDEVDVPALRSHAPQ